MNVTVMYEPITCYLCGMRFEVAAGWKQSKMQSGEYFYCPNGHKQHFCDSPEERLKKQLATVLSTCDQVQAENRNLLRQVRSQKKAAAKTRKRVGNGVCPCCNRYFAKLHAHMKTKHPEHGK